MLRTLKNKKNGFSLVEVIVAALIFSIAAAGLFTAISLTRQPAVSSTKELEAAWCAKYYLDWLSAKVSANTWNTPGTALYPGVYYNTCGAFNVNYNIIDNPVTGGRDIAVSVNWI